MRRVDLADLNVSAQGLGCMGMSEFYGPADWNESIATIHRAIELGVTFIDTADQYGSGHNEVLVGRAIHDRRDRVQLATKFGIDRSAGDSARVMRGDAAYVKRACEASLTRLGTDVIDIYYLHRPPENAQIEETVGAMSELVSEGKVRHLGLSEIDAGLLRRAHAVHRITAVQSEYSLWARDVEAVAPVMSELNVGLVAYAPLGRGFLTGLFDPAGIDAGDVRTRTGRFVGNALVANMAIADAVRRIAGERGLTPAELSLAWVHAQSERLCLPVVPIPGTKHIRWLEQNVGSLDLALEPSELAELEPLSELVQGSRHPGFSAASTG